MIRILIAASLFAAGPAAAVRYVVAPLPVAGTPAINPQGLGEDGTIVGQTSATLQPAMQRADGSFTQLPTLGGPRGSANAINASGTIVGNSRSGPLVTSSQPYVRLADGTTTIIPLPSRTGPGSASGINDSGEVVGDYQTDTGFVAYRWNGVSTTVLATPANFTYAAADAVNAGGTTAGEVYDDDGQGGVARWAPDGSLTVLAGIDGGIAGFGGLNNRGWIAGYSTIGADANHGVVWDAAGHPTDVGVLAGDTISYLWDINDHGVAIGVSLSADAFGQQINPHLVRWTQAGGLEQLDIDLRGTGLVLIDLAKINNAGQIVAVASPVPGQRMAVLLNPVAATVPEPAAWLFLVIGFGTVGLAGRRVHRVLGVAAV